jgi:conjugal transfer pilus assembly protein TraW
MSYFGLFLTTFMTILICLIIVLSAQAKDFGIHGESQQITEIDMEEYIITSLKNVGEEKLINHQKMIAKKMIEKIKTPNKVKGISSATENATRYFDPTFRVEDDILDDKNQIMYHRGHKINPLDHKAFDEIWLMINGDDEKELAFAKNYGKADKTEKLANRGKEKNTQITQITKITQNTKTIKIILVNGSPGSQEDGNFFYFDQFGEISKKLDITKTPSVIIQANDKKLIEIQEIAL